ncbi:MAG TPA: hypothetical protein ACQGQH_04315 [Xylella sp.]
MRELTTKEIGSVDGGVYVLNLHYKTLGFPNLFRKPALMFLGFGNSALVINLGQNGSSFYIKPTLNIDNVNVINTTQEIHQGT